MKPPASTVYLDDNATTPHDPEVVAAMLPFLDPHYGNPSSFHRYGAVARRAVAEAREQVAELLGREPVGCQSVPKLWKRRMQESLPSET